MTYKQTAWALRTKDGKWHGWYKRLRIGYLFDSAKMAKQCAAAGDRVVRVCVTMEVLP